MKINELADKLWEGCDGCTETDKEMWVNGFISGYNYSAREEVSDEEIEQELKHSIHFLKTPKEINRIWAIGDHMAKWMRSKLTHQPVSEGRIMNAFTGNCHHSLGGTQMLNEKEFKAAIKELNR